jgi:wobble nucleotide-excising tRNase
VIVEIKMQDVASYKSPTSLTTDKKINLIYGLNGTGKSTISNYLYDLNQPRFKQCTISPANTTTILVYNQTFIKENFYESDSLKGIFSLSKENKAAEQKISDTEKKLAELQKNLSEKRGEKATAERERDTQRQAATDKVWKIKNDYTGGDRVLEYCLDGLKGQKDKLFSHVVSLPKPESQPLRADSELKKEVDSLKGDSAQYLSPLSNFVFTQHEVESNPILNQAIVGNDDSVVAGLIEKLGNSDWVRDGLGYIPEAVEDSGSPCPFCQKNTVTPSLVSDIRNYFDETYQAAITSLERLESDYKKAIFSLPNLNTIIDHPLATDSKQEIEHLHSNLLNILNANLAKISDKLKNPRGTQTLTSSGDAIATLNKKIEGINQLVSEHNTRLQNKSASLEKLKKEFWILMRWNYDQTVERFQQDMTSAEKKIIKLSGEIKEIEKSITAEEDKIVAAQKETVNIDEAIESINAGLHDLAIQDFVIKKHSENLYRIVRSGDSNNTFHTLSEGERMIISFLYFCELCKGRLDAKDTGSHRIVVIDDPISSLSHIYIFNIGQLIKTLFFRLPRFKQVFVLTHSLYFFYELTDTNHDRRKETQNLFRLVKNTKGSLILPMKYEEIQNDYQSYWEIVKDESQPPALVANCMRNIVEYFFNFVKKKDLNNIFQIPELQGAKHQAFCRYMNRESHSLGQNIYDLKEFDYNIFREGLKLVFQETGFPEHYEQMMKA